MKTPMKRTVFKVILRKSEYKEQWSLLIESFPVFEVRQRQTTSQA